jgi:hypothetical protein
MQAAFLAVPEKEAASFEETLAFRISRSALDRYVINLRQITFNAAQITIGRKPILPPKREADLAEYCHMEERFFCFCDDDVRSRGPTTGCKERKRKSL